MYIFIHHLYTQTETVKGLCETVHATMYQKLILEKKVLGQRY